MFVAGGQRRVSKLVKGGVKVASICDTRNGGVPYAIVRTNPYIIARVGAIRGSACRTMRVTCSRGDRGRADDDLLKRFGGTNAAPGHGVTRFGNVPRIGLNSALAIRLFSRRS